MEVTRRELLARRVFPLKASKNYLYSMANENSEYPRISFIIQHPSRDLDSENYTGARIYTRGAVHSLDNIVPSQAVRACVGIPAYIIKMVGAAFNDGHYRVELLIGETEYKFYRKPKK